MTRVLFAATGVALLLNLAGCEKAPQEATTNIEVPEGDYQARLQAMPEGERNGVFIRAVRDAGFECQGVESSAFKGEMQGAPTWTARCDNGTEWTILIDRAGVAQVAPAQKGSAAPVEPGENKQ